MILTVAFGKGGTGKTSTAHAFANYARMKGKSVLSIDADKQANFSFALGGNPTHAGLSEIMTGEAQPAQVIQQTSQTHLIPPGIDLARAQQLIINRPGRDFILKNALREVREQYDMIIIDTPPDLNTILVNALSASDSVLLPMQANSFSFLGLYQIGETISQVQEYCNPSLTIEGIVLTRFKARQILATDMRDSIIQQAQEMNTRVFDTYIREGVAVEQSQAMQQSLFDFAPRSNPAQDYMNLFEEMNI